MDSAVRRGSDHELHTATSLGDPVLIRLTSDLGRVHVVLLADEVRYDHAGVIRLARVRWASSPRGVRAIIRVQRWSSRGYVGELCLQRGAGHFGVAVPGRPAIRVPDDERHVGWANLTREAYLACRAATPQRLVRVACAMTRPPQRRAPAKLAVAARAATAQLRHWMRSTKRAALAVARV